MSKGGVVHSDDYFKLNDSVDSCSLDGSVISVIPYYLELAALSLHIPLSFPIGATRLKVYCMVSLSGRFEKAGINCNSNSVLIHQFTFSKNE